MPAAILRACGHPGSRVVLRVPELVVPRASCNLTGVVLVYAGIAVTVPAHGGAGSAAIADGPAGSSTTWVTVDQASGDVTFTVRRS